MLFYWSCSPARSKPLQVVWNGRCQWCLQAWQAWKNLVVKCSCNIPCLSFFPRKTAGWANMTDFIAPRGTRIHRNRKKKWKSTAQTCFSFSHQYIMNMPRPPTHPTCATTMFFFIFFFPQPELWAQPTPLVRPMWPLTHLPGSHIPSSGMWMSFNRCTMLVVGDSIFSKHVWTLDRAAVCLWFTKHEHHFLTVAVLSNHHQHHYSIIATFRVFNSKQHIKSLHHAKKTQNSCVKKFSNFASVSSKHIRRLMIWIHIIEKILTISKHWSEWT